MATFKEEMQGLAYELIVLDSDFRTVSMQATHVKPINQTYDEQTGEVFSYDSEEIVTAMVGPYVNSQVNAQDIQLGDMRMILPVLGSTLIPEPQNDFMVLENGETFRVLTVALDPAEAVYTIQLRKCNGNDSY